MDGEKEEVKRGYFGREFCCTASAPFLPWTTFDITLNIKLFYPSDSTFPFLSPAPALALALARQSWSSPFDFCNSVTITRYYLSRLCCRSLTCCGNCPPTHSPTAQYLSTLTSFSSICRLCTCCLNRSHLLPTSLLCYLEPYLRLPHERPQLNSWRRGRKSTHHSL